MNPFRWVLGLLTHNFWWKLLALGIACIIWAVVASEPERSSFETVRLEYGNLPDDLEISSGPTETVALELRGPASELAGGSRRPAVVVDMSGAAPGQRPDRSFGQMRALRREMMELLCSEGAAAVLQDAGKPHGLLTTTGGWQGVDRPKSQPDVLPPPGLGRSAAGLGSVSGTARVRHEDLSGEGD